MALMILQLIDCNQLLKSLQNKSLIQYTYCKIDLHHLSDNHRWLSVNTLFSYCFNYCVFIYSFYTLIRFII